MSEALAARPLLVETRDEVRQVITGARQQGLTIGLVPTMGALHAGHLSLVEASLKECAFTAVTVFVNPVQFGPGEDYHRYPRSLDADLDALRQRGADLVFAPSVTEMYPPGHQTYVEVGDVAAEYEGALRPGHFRGVATIVLKLFHLIPADVAFFGQKDYQQSLVVRQMVKDFNLAIRIRTGPIVREPDGLAMSSRNVYLSPEDRRRARSLSQSLQLAGALVAGGERNVAVIRRQMLEHLRTMGKLEPQYVGFFREGTMTPVDCIEGPAVVALAAIVGTTRLIDNAIVGVP